MNAKVLRGKIKIISSLVLKMKNVQDKLNIFSLEKRMFNEWIKPIGFESIMVHEAHSTANRIEMSLSNIDNGSAEFYR